MSALFILHRVAQFSDFIVYRRGDWCLAHRVPRYLVSRESTGRDLEEFLRRKSAINVGARTGRQMTPLGALAHPISTPAEKSGVT